MPPKSHPPEPLEFPPAPAALDPERTFTRLTAKFPVRHLVPHMGMSSDSLQMMRLHPAERLDVLTLKGVLVLAARRHEDPMMLVQDLLKEVLYGWERQRQAQSKGQKKGSKAKPAEGPPKQPSSRQLLKAHRPGPAKRGDGE